jgi:hypothetical protein
MSQGPVTDDIEPPAPADPPEPAAPALPADPPDPNVAPPPAPAALAPPDPIAPADPDAPAAASTPAVPVARPALPVTPPAPAARSAPPKPVTPPLPPFAPTIAAHVPALPASLDPADLPEHAVAVPATTTNSSADNVVFGMVEPPRKKCPRAITTGHRCSVAPQRDAGWPAVSRSPVPAPWLTDRQEHRRRPPLLSPGALAVLQEVVNQGQVRGRAARRLYRLAVFKHHNAVHVEPRRV